MKLLLDTHILLWVLVDDARLPNSARTLIEDSSNEIYFSAISPWEVQIKHDAHPDRLKLTGSEFLDYCKRSGFAELPVKAKHVSMLELLDDASGSQIHRDPFDRMLICQAMAEQMMLLTHDKRIAAYNNPNVLAL